MFLLLVLGLLAVLYFICDKISPPQSSQQFSLLLRTCKTCAILLLFQLLCLIFAELLTRNTANFSILRLLGFIPYPRVFVFTYIFLFCLYQYHKIKKDNRYHLIMSIKYKYLQPLDCLSYVNLEIKHLLKIHNEKLTLLKSLSPIPIVVFIFNNLSVSAAPNFNLPQFISENQLNIVLIVIIFIFTYHLFKTYLLIQDDLFLLSLIAKEQFLLQNPSALDMKENA